MLGFNQFMALRNQLGKSLITRQNHRRWNTTEQRFYSTRVLRSMVKKRIERRSKDYPIKAMVPVAYEVLRSRNVLFNGVSSLLKSFPIVACKYCPEVYIGEEGHLIKNCRGFQRQSKNQLHQWSVGDISDVLVSVEAFHLQHMFQDVITHDQRFDLERVPAVLELCWQAGVDPNTVGVDFNANLYPNRAGFDPNADSYHNRSRVDRNAEPYHNRTGVDPNADSYHYRAGVDQNVDSFHNRSMVDQIARVDRNANSYHNRADSYHDRSRVDQNANSHHNRAAVDQNSGVDRNSNSCHNTAGVDPNSEVDPRLVAETTLAAWETLRLGVKRLLLTYPAKVCKYCSEVHIGPSGHLARNCGLFKFQSWRGKHFWEKAEVDDLVPPKIVWRRRPQDPTVLVDEGRDFYGHAPAVVDLCSKAGVVVPVKYHCMMKLQGVSRPLRP